jgi:hypothetical protein
MPDLQSLPVSMKTMTRLEWVYIRSDKLPAGAEQSLASSLPDARINTRNQVFK